MSTICMFLKEFSFSIVFVALFLSSSSASARIVGWGLLNKKRTGGGRGLEIYNYIWTSFMDHPLLISGPQNSY